MKKKGETKTKKKGRSIIGSVVNKSVDLLPVEAHLPGYNYCGPGTKLDKRLKREDKGVNKLDDACKLHDIAYTKYSDSKTKTEADKALVERAWERVVAPDSSLTERATAYAVTNAMKLKFKFGGRLKLKKSDRTVKKKIIDSIPRRALYDDEFREYAKRLKIPYFRSVFMLDALPKKIGKNECAIVNLDSSRGNGIHWVCFRKVGNNVEYFDGIGNVHPPPELMNYFGKSNVTYNYNRYQADDHVICGRLCLEFLPE